MTKNIIVFLSPGFEEVEAVSIIDVLRRAGLNVSTFSIAKTKEVEGSHNIKILADELFSNYYNDNYSLKDSLFTQFNPDAVVLPGGMPGSKNLQEHKAVQNLLKQMKDNNKTIGAICAAPIALNEAGILKGVKYTCYPGFEKGLSGEKQDERVSRDGNIFTANGPGSALDFALNLVKHFTSVEKADKLAAQMMIKN